MYSRNQHLVQICNQLPCITEELVSEAVSYKLSADALTCSSFASWTFSLSSSFPRLQCHLAEKGRQRGDVQQLEEPQGKWHHEVGIWVRGYLCPGRSRRRPVVAYPKDLAGRRFWKRMQFWIDFLQLRLRNRHQAIIWSNVNLYYCHQNPRRRKFSVTAKFGRVHSGYHENLVGCTRDLMS